MLAAVAIAVWPDPRARLRSAFINAAFFTNAGMAALVFIGYIQFTLFTGGLQFEERLPWVPADGISYHLGLDGIGAGFLLSGTIGGLVAILASTGIRDRIRTYLVLVLLAQGALNGILFARDLFVLVLFWTVSAVPVSLLVWGWGGPHGPRAARRFLLYALSGAALLLAGVLLLYTGAGGVSFDLDHIGKALPAPRLEVAAGILLILAAATRLPIVPLHGWARDILAEAPPGVAVLVAVELMRTGGYLLVRVVVGVDHDGARLLAPFLAAGGGATCAWAALKALRSTGIRPFAANLALIPGGVAAVACAGLTPLALDGAVLELIGGGLAGALIVLACAYLAERAPAPDLAGAAGLGQRTPRLAWALVLGALAVLGVPGFLTFLGQFMSASGAFRAQPAGVILALVGLVVAGAAAARLLHRLVFGAVAIEVPARVRDLALSEFWALAILAGALIWFGVLPNGPKLAGVPLFDPGIVNVVNGAVGDLIAPYIGP